ncbi:MAG: carboxypeptidase regulatory-like domain-containing protein, partial [Ignavibacteriaceae bacterium]|nr:carboxypeptidase regulatory-like domain-containing protein [Ignavibacteriaceae bacterium]
MLKQLIALFVLSVSLFAQSVDDQYFEKNGEVYFRFPVFNKLELQEITKIISIDKFDGKMVTAYANKDQFRKFQKTGYKVEVLPPPGDVPVEMGNPRALGLWDVYPSYETYVQMLNDLAADYPNLCRVVDAGTTTQGRKILFVVISDNVNVTEPEPRFMHSSSMHGDETAAFVNMIRLADHLLSNYNVDPLITKLVNGLEIWINPAANPDGTYRSGNATVTGARRGNANNVDINRNFPDPVQGQHPDGYAWQPETIAMMNLGNSTYFNMSANYHGGAEVVNYPWDSRSARHADDNWWQQVSRRYADTVHFYCNNNGYLSEFNNGITNGWDWYSVYGGRQDWFTYFKFGREVTIELSNTKLISASYIPTIWNYNRAAWLNLMNELLSGVGGVVKSPEGVPVKVKVTVLSHDHTNAEVFSDSISGAYTRMIFPGTYDLTFTAAGYDPVTVNGVVVSSGVKTPLD